VARFASIVVVLAELFRALGACIAPHTSDHARIGSASHLRSLSEPNRSTDVRHEKPSGPPPGIILTPQTTRPIPLGSAGLWFDGTAIYYVATDGTQAALTTTATTLVLDPNGSDITKVGGAASAPGATRFGADAGHRHQLDPSGFKPFYFVGLAAPGAIAAPGANVGDKVVDVESLSDLAGAAASFETTISVANQIQQKDPNDLSKKKFRVLIVAQS
jgi:hypothetical protein